MEGIYDFVIDELHKRRELLRNTLSERYKKEKPFRMEPVGNEAHFYVYDNMNEQDVNYAIQTYGRDDVNQWMMEVQNKRGRL